jgi:fluoride ion exporter CrcB/FEX
MNATIYKVPLFILCIVGLTLSYALAQAPQIFNYQALCLNLNGSPTINRVVNFHGEILHGSITAINIILGFLSVVNTPSPFSSELFDNQDGNSLHWNGGNGRIVIYY